MARGSSARNAFVAPLIAGLVLAGCGSGADKADSSAGSASASASAAVSSSTVAGSGPVGATTTAIAAPSTTASSPKGSGAVAATTSAAPATGGSQVNANTASIPELQAAFAAAGVPQAQRWAEEVDEYRPYSPDPKWGKLRQELGKYNIDPNVLEKIISLLVI